MCITDDEEPTGTSKEVASAACAQAAADPVEIIDSDTELNPHDGSQVPLSTVPLVSAETQEASSDLPVGDQTFANPQFFPFMCIDSDDEDVQAAPLTKWPGEAAVVAPNLLSFRRSDTSASNVLVPEDLDKDDSASYVGGSTDSLEKSMAAVRLTSQEATRLRGLHALDVAPNDVVPVPKVSKYPEVSPPQPEFLESMDKCVAEAEPPLYNSTGLAGGKNKRRRRGKQPEGHVSKKRKAGGHEEDAGNAHDDHDDDDDGEPMPEDEEMDEPTPEPVKASARKQKHVAENKKKATVEEKVPDNKKAPVDPKNPEVTDAVCKKAAKKAVEPTVDPPVDAKVRVPKKAKVVEPKKAEPVAVDAKVADKDEGAAAQVGKEDGVSSDDLPSREELEKKGAFVPPDHIHGNNIYSNAYRQSLKTDNCKEKAKTQGRRATAIFKAYGLCLPEMIGSFRSARRKPNSIKQGTADAEAKQD
ncbi:unnamed protein product [Symbiodinium sp. CCMP2592]|nr:unnamed protein product [Symbiodinium sp. CCMP2592]